MISSIFPPRQRSPGGVAGGSHSTPRLEVDRRFSGRCSRHLVVVPRSSSPGIRLAAGCFRFHSCAPPLARARRSLRLFDLLGPRSTLDRVPAPSETSPVHAKPAFRDAGGIHRY